MPEGTVTQSVPVIVGVGQASERIDDPDYAALGEADLAAAAVRQTLADTGADPAAVVAAVEVIAAVRSFEKSSPAAHSPFGRPDNFPRAVAARTGMDPARAVEEVTGGQSPQHLVTEFAAEIAAGRAGAVLLVGAEAMSTVRQAARSDGDKPDFSEQVGGQLEDRGYQIAGMVSVEEVKHGIIAPPTQYALLENARRHRSGLSRSDYVRQMGELFAPMTTVAAANPHAAAPRAYTADELIEVSSSNRMIADPYPRRLVARDQVNQAAAVLLMSEDAAAAAGIDRSRWVYLHGHADTVEQPLLARPDLSQAPAQPAAVREALEMAGLTIDQIDAFDLYSCFPVAVSVIADAFGLAADDPRGLTATGGLPYFGGPGNNYSMHGIAEIVQRVRRTPGSHGLVTANGGMLSKLSVGIYSTEPVPWRPSTSPALQAGLDARPRVPLCRFPDGPATIETFTVTDPDRDSRTGLVIGRMADGSRFVGAVDPRDEALFTRLAGEDDPVGTGVWVRSAPDRNHVTVDEATMDRLHPRRPVGFRDSYEDVLVRREGRVLEIVINRPQSRNALSPKTNDELDEIFDAYFADPELWVAILTGAGDKAFSSGNDLAASAGTGALATPANGFGGLTSRRDKPKPIIAAVNGYALGGGLEVALACHLIVADPAATFGLPEVKVGLVAAAGGLVRLPRAVPEALARDMILTGRRLTAPEALAHGLVSRVAEPGDVLALAREVAAEILAASPTSVRESIAVMAESDGQPDTVTAVRESLSVLDRVLVSSDTREGILAFVQKRAPRWTGR
ncbi:putative enoyl-CoA hydratase [Gordonia hirsuta DSM 44140 = NBRC 16056]|uniref:Probable enoyl-CoA hydratase EchA17 n=1 Tax=Gordonia hirsuta DSM 44140 = NBRC 16056 TaxID=1121927 RepID=L7L893_9ACTN|nr:acetyl-CoA acetyltransferase [Gordonia hirsuta]GAC56248.1 putative enoyl-CoA hydratase [Gordonia hirsuta DSM 44140 = NBRC 16056]